jgi:hypothetical protein
VLSGGIHGAPLLIHIGYHKTGTTWLQRVLFQPEFGYSPIMEHAEVFTRLVRPHNLTFDPAPVRDAIEGRRGAGEVGSVDLISSEILSGNPLLGGRESDVYAQRLKRVAPNARILITIREQMRALTSVYMQYLLRGGTLSPKAFFADEPEIGYVAFAPEHLEYHRLVALYRDLFGPENVLVATQESLAADSLAFAERLAAFAGVRRKIDLAKLPTERMSPSAPEFATPLLRRINHFRSGPAGLGPVFDLGPVSAFAYRATGALGRRLDWPALKKFRPVSDEVARRFTGRYADSNSELKAMLGDRIDLSKYPMSAAARIDSPVQAVAVR